MHILQKIVHANKKGRRAGVYSCCSANRDVIKAAFIRAIRNDTIVLIESTVNQVNQLGGYTGMTPSDFRKFVDDIAEDTGIARNRVILGGDHLGPLPWCHLPEKEAMSHAEEMIHACILAGYTKIHLDTSMRLGDDDPAIPLSVNVCARRGAQLCQVAEYAFNEYLALDPEADKPIYVIGSEVPVPGGDVSCETCSVTDIADCLGTLDAYRDAFEAIDLADVFNRVIAIVVQLGVEFSDRMIDNYDRKKNHSLVDGMRRNPIGFEAHSTDYQTPANLCHMTDDGAVILKVGPALTFALREALFALESIERELYSQNPEVLSDFKAILEEVMADSPKSWTAYYHGSDEDRRLSRAYSYYDRSRYYFPDPKVAEARDRLIDNLSCRNIPLCMLSQYFPRQYLRIRNSELQNNPEAIISDKIGDTIDVYLMATGNNGMPEGYQVFLSSSQ